MESDRELVERLESKITDYCAQLQNPGSVTLGINLREAKSLLSLAHAGMAAKGLVEALDLATKELNAIRARDGAPQHIDWHRGQPIQTDGCTKEWWNELTEKCFAALAAYREAVSIKSPRT